MKRSQSVRWVVGAFAVTGVLLLAASSWLWIQNTRDEADSAATQTSSLSPAATVARGAYLAQVGNCAGCHTARGGAAYAGGLGINTPFGAVYASNLTPDVANEIGRAHV